MTEQERLLKVAERRLWAALYQISVILHHRITDGYHQALREVDAAFRD